MDGSADFMGRMPVGVKSKDRAGFGRTPVAVGVIDNSVFKEAAAGMEIRPSMLWREKKKKKEFEEGEDLNTEFGVSC